MLSHYPPLRAAKLGVGSKYNSRENPTLRYCYFPGITMGPIMRARVVGLKLWLKAPFIKEPQTQDCIPTSCIIV